MMTKKPIEIVFSEEAEGRYDRQYLISWWDQDILLDANVIVVGAGALGNEVLKLLALIGVGQITVIDYDVVSPSNLARMVLFTEKDVGRLKVEVALEKLQQINPAIELNPICGDLRFDIGLGDYRKADLVFGCLDSIHSRWALNRKCFQAGVDWIDAGISDFHGLVSFYSHESGACYECTFTETTKQRFDEKYSCPFGLVDTQHEVKVPTTAVTTSAIAALQVQQGINILHGIDEGLKPGERIMLYLKPFGFTKDSLPYNPDCLAHFSLPADIPVVEYSKDISLLEALLLARGCDQNVNRLHLGFEFTKNFSCPSCGNFEEIMRPLEKVTKEDGICPDCGEDRIPETFRSIDENSPEGRFRFKEIGIPPREILAFSAEDEDIFIQFGS